MKALLKLGVDATAALDYGKMMFEDEEEEAKGSKPFHLLLKALKEKIHSICCIISSTTHGK